MWQARRRFPNPQCGSPDGCHAARPHARTRGACMRTPYRLRNRPATRRCAEIRPGARVAGLAGQCQSLALGGSRPHPDRYGRRRSFAAAASLSASAPAAASQAPCVPVALAAVLHVPSVAAAARVRSAATSPGAGGGSRSAGARPLRVDTRPSPHSRRHCLLPPRRARTASM